MTIARQQLLQEFTIAEDCVLSHQLVVSVSVMLHLKGDKQSTAASLIQKTIARSQAANSAAAVQAAKNPAAWARAAGFGGSSSDHNITAEQANFLNAQSNYDSAIQKRNQQQLPDSEREAQQQVLASNSQSIATALKHKEADAVDSDDDDDLDLNAIREQRIAALRTS